MSSSKRNRSHPVPIGPASTGRQVETFRAWGKQIACPGCGLEYTDAAVDWMDAWSEGQRDMLNALRPPRKDGPIDFREEELGRDTPGKIRCACCGAKAWLSPFGPPVLIGSTEEPSQAPK